MASKININLDTSKENYLVAKCKQNDDLTLEASIFENGLALDLTNKTITIQALKSDNTYIIQNTDIVKENNKINAELDRDFSRVPGTTKIEIVLVESSKQNTTFSFYLEVVGSVIRGAVQSSNTATILEALDNKIIEAGQVKQETEELVQSGGAATKGEVQEINASLEHINTKKVDAEYVNNKIGNIVSGTPKGTYANLNALKTAKPTGDSGIYITTDNGNWNYWNGTTWVSGGVYQSTGIGSYSIKNDKYSFNSIFHHNLEFSPTEGKIGKNLFDMAFIETSKRIDGTNGSIYDNPATYFLSGFIKVTPTTKYTIQKKECLAYYDENFNWIGGSAGSENYRSTHTFTTPSNCFYIRVSTDISLLDLVQIEIGGVATRYEKFGNYLDTEFVRDKSLDENKINYPLVKGERSPNIFNKSLIEISKRIQWNSGAIYDNPASYFLSDFIEIEANTNYTIKYKEIITFFDENKVYLSGIDPNINYRKSYTFTTPVNAKYIRISTDVQYLNLIQLEKGTIEHEYYEYGYVLNGSRLQQDSIPLRALKVKSNKRSKLYTLAEASIRWKNGEKFPITFIGDSTTDGVATTSFVANITGKDSVNNNAYPKLLENLLRTELNNSNLRIYNGGYASKHLEWILQNIETVFGSDFSDTKMVGISCGINDKLLYNADTNALRNSFKSNCIKIIEWLFDKGIQPFMLTTQATITPNLRDNDVTTFPIRLAMITNTICNEVKKELADEYNLEIIDVTSYTENFLKYSNNTLNETIPDKLHFGDIGHKYEAGLFFSKIINRTIEVTDYTKLDYSTQNIIGVSEDLVSYTNGKFKLHVNTTKSDTSDKEIFNCLIFIDGKNGLNLKSYINSVGTTYVLIDGVKTVLNSVEQDLGYLDLGLHKLQVFTGISNKVDFKGFELIKTNN